MRRANCTNCGLAPTGWELVACQTHERRQSRGPEPAGGEKWAIRRLAERHFGPEVLNRLSCLQLRESFCIRRTLQTKQGCPRGWQLLSSTTRWGRQKTSCSGTAKREINWSAVWG